MKKISNSIRIGLVPRKEVPSKLDSEHMIPNAQSTIKQQVHPQNNYTSHAFNPFDDHQHRNPFTSATNIRLHHTNEIDTKKVQSTINNLNNYHSLPPARPRQETMSEVYEVPSKTKPVTLKKVLIGLAIALVIIAIIVGVVLAVVLTRSQDTTTTTLTVSTTSTITIAPTVVSAVWSFDNVTNELYGVYNGSMVNGGGFSNATSQTFPYFGSGQALQLNGINQFVSVPSPVFPLNSTSFTIEAWIYPTSLTSDRGIFGQCECTTCANRCFYLICRASRLLVDFVLNDLTGSTTLLINTWYHVAFVYNYETKQQILYVNGVQDAIKSNAAPYQGVNGSIQIGSTEIFGSTNFFSGLIDNLWVTTRAKSASEILRDASLIVYFSFDLPNPNSDSGPNQLSGVPLNTVTVSGRVNEAMRFVGSSSYFYVYGLFQVPTGLTTNRPFSVSLWFNPTASGSYTLVQLFTFGSPLRCSNLLSVTSGGGTTGQIVVQSANNVPATLTGPFVTQNVWTHISVTYGFINGFTLYFNGIYFGATGNVTYQSSGILSYLFIGYILSCSGASNNVAYQGSIDEVYVYNREITQAEVTVLANP